MVRLAAGKQQQGKDMEMVSLTGGGSRSPKAALDLAAAASGGGVGRYKNLIWIVLVGCVVLFLWDHSGGNDSTAAGESVSKLKEGKKVEDDVVIVESEGTADDKIPETVEDHDHDGDGIQDHAPEDHVDQEDEIKEGETEPETNSESDVTEKAADDGQEKEIQQPGEPEEILNDSEPHTTGDGEVQEKSNTQPPDDGTSVPKLGAVANALGLPAGVASTTPPVLSGGPATTMPGVPEATTVAPGLPGGATTLMPGGATITPGLLPQQTMMPGLPGATLTPGFIPGAATMAPGIPAANTLLPGATMGPGLPAATLTPGLTGTGTGTIQPGMMAGSATLMPGAPGAATIQPGLLPQTTVPPLASQQTTLPGAATVIPDPNLHQQQPPVSPQCQQQCAVPPIFDATIFDEQDMTLASHMRERVKQFRQKWIDTTLKKEYGQYYEAIFEPTIDGVKTHVGNQRAFKDPMALPLPNQPPPETTGIGWTRSVKKWQMKLLQVQMGIVNQQLDTTGFCTDRCSSEEFQMTPGTFSKFVWINGGHSASAGHGNFYPESYTAILGDDLRPILKEIGVDFIAKNYAMGGTESAEEVALCINSIFGKDFDHITWDYGMTDGRDFYKMAMYAYRAARLSQHTDVLSQPGSLRHRPSFLALHQNDDYNAVLRNLQKMGMTVLGMDQGYKNEDLMDAFPDMFGMSDAVIATLPPMVQYFKCDGQIENGEPGCKDQKYNITMCETRKARASWHPGKKYHAFIGHLMSFTVLELIDQALEGLIQLEAAVPQPETPQDKKLRLWSQLQALDAAEQADYDYMHQTPIPPDMLEHFQNQLWARNPTHKEPMASLKMRSLVKDATFCHTAMLPAEIRYRGILTENFTAVGGPVDEKYEHAVLHTAVAYVENPGPRQERDPAVYVDDRPERRDHMILAAKDDERDQCDAQTNADFKDYFMVTSRQDWLWMKIPNAAEQAYYTEFKPQKSIGWILICPAVCDWNNCRPGDIRQQVIESSIDPEFGGITMEVNLVKVTGVNCMNHCCALKHDHPDPAQQFVWKPTAEGKYEFRAMISGGTSWGYVRISSFILL